MMPCAVTPHVRMAVALVALGAPAAAAQSAVRPFTLETGEFAVHYEPAAGSMTIRHRDRSATLETRLAAGELFDVTSPEFVQAVTLSNQGEITRVRITAERDWASFRGLVEVYERSPGLIRLRVDVTAKRATQIADSFPELRLVDSGGRARSPAPQIYRQQVGIEAPAAYLYDEAFGGSVLYFQNLTSLNPYLDQVQGDPRFTVRVDESGIGFRRPHGSVPPAFSFTITDAYIWLSPDRPKDDLAQANQYLHGIFAIYDRLEKPGTVYTDWLAIAPNAARGLLDPINGVSVSGTRLLKAYVGDIERQVESIVNLDVLLPARQYARNFGADASIRRLIADIERGIRYWYVPVEGGGRTVADVPRPPAAVDSWYYVYPLVQMVDLAREGNADAREMVLGSVPKLLELGRAFDYEFPFRLNAATASRADDRFRELDVSGGYAYVMLGAYELTHDGIYLDEAKRAVEHIRGKAFRFTYELQMTGVTLDALAWLYELTGSERYIDLSAIPLANIVALTWLWEPDYGYAKAYRLFMGTNPLPGADQVAAFELHNTWGSLQRFYRRTERVLPRHLRTLIAELLKYQLTVGRYTLPRFLPGEALCRTPDWGTLRTDMDIPVEDLKDGFHKSAMVGQEIYGSGISFRFAAEAYRVLGPSRAAVLFAEYPITDASWSASAQTLDFRLGGTPNYRSRVRVYFRGAAARQALRAQVRAFPDDTRNVTAIDVARSNGYIEFFVPGGLRYQVLVPPASSVVASSDLQRRGSGAPNARRGTPALAQTRVGAILGAGGVVQVEAGRPLSIPLVIAHTGSSAAEVSFEAELPSGWRLERRALRLAPGQSGHVLRIVPSAGLQPGQLHAIAIRMRSGSTVTPILHTLVRGVARTDEAVGEVFREFRVSGSNGRLSIEDGTAVFTTTEPGAAAFTTRAFTVDLDQFPCLDFRVDAVAGTWAVKVYEENGSPWGTYVLPEMPVVPEARATGWFRIRLPERTGWSGIHSFKVMLFVVGQSGSALRVAEWRLSAAEATEPAR
jgi:hypothetical protein